MVVDGVVVVVGDVDDTSCNQAVNNVVISIGRKKKKSSFTYCLELPRLLTNRE